MLVKKSFLFLLLLTCMWLITYISSRITLQFDFTHDKIYTLTEGSKNIIKEIKDPVTLRLYYSRDTENLPIWLKNYANRLISILQQYEKENKEKVILEMINPLPDSTKQVEAIQAGVRGQPTSSGEDFFLGLVAIQGDSQKTIEIFSPDREEFLEYDISKVIYDVQSDNKPILGWISTLPILNIEDPARPEKSIPRDWAIGEEIKNSFTIEMISEDQIDESVDILAIIHPPRISPQLQFAIDQFLLHGKPVLIAVDPSSLFERANSSGKNRFNNSNSGINKLLAKWGITYDNTSVIGDFELGYPLPFGEGSSLKSYPVWMNFKDFENSSPVVSQLENVLFLEAGSFEIHRPTGFRLDPLLKTTKESGTMMASSLSFSTPDQIPNQINIDRQEKIVAGIISGKFQTAFPDGKPPLEGSLMEEFSDVIPQEYKTPYITESKTTSRLALLCDTDFLVDDYSVQRGNFMGATVTQPINDNLLLFSNLLDQLSGSNNLVRIRGKGNTLRTFTRIDKMRVAAEKKFRTQLEIAERRVSDIEKELQELEILRQRGNADSINLEIEETISKLEEEEIAAKAERRRIRKELREDIETLGIALAALNLLPVPSILLIAGSIYFYRRNRKNK